MPTVIRYNAPKREDVTSPTAGQLWVLACVQQALGRVPRFEVGALEEDLAWSHHEDEALGLPPLGTRASVFVALPRLELHMHTGYWHAPGDAAIQLEAHDRRESEGVVRSQLLSDPRATQLLSSLGLAPWGSAWCAEWKVRHAQDAEVVAAIARMVEELAALDLPASP